jgi:hypothetical protein
MDDETPHRQLKIQLDPRHLADVHANIAQELLAAPQDA